MKIIILPSKNNLLSSITRLCCSWGICFRAWEKIYLLAIGVCILHRSKSPSEKDSFRPARSLSWELYSLCTSALVSASAGEINRFFSSRTLSVAVLTVSFIALFFLGADYLTFEGGTWDSVWVNLRSGWECMRTANIRPDLRLIGLGKNFFPQTSGDRNFFLTYNTYNT